MTNTLVFGDVHGNLPALEAVIEHAEAEAGGWERAVCTGDIVGILGWAKECVDVVASLCDDAVFGNHDARVRGDFSYAPSHRAAKDEHRVVTEQLGEAEVRWLRELPKRVETDEYILAHSRPAYQRDPGYPVHGFAKGDYGVPPGDATRVGPHIDGKAALLGHTHRQHGVSVDKFPGQSGAVINPGSVGVPWYEDAHYAMVDTAAQTWDFYSVEYDNERVQRQLQHQGTPPTEYNNGRL